MSTKQIKKFRIEWQQGSWVITDPGAPEARSFSVDGAVVNATARGNGFVEGFIVSVHGLDMAVAGTLNKHQLRDLGVGSHLRAHAVAPSQRAAGKVHLLAGGQIQGGR